MAGRFDWAVFESELFDELRLALADVGQRHAQDRFYAVALHGVSRELDGLLSLPLLAAAIETGSPDADGDGFWGERFNPESWALAEVALREQPVLQLERALTAEATRGSPAHWRRTESRYARLLVRLARRLRDQAPELLPVSQDFIAFWHDEAGGPELAAKTIPRALFTKLFVRQVSDARERRAARALPVAERAALLVTRFGCFEGVTSEDAQHELLALGREAQGALVDKLSDSKHGWTAAKVLGQIGVATPSVIEALRARADGLWYAMALGMLGDFDWLSSQSQQVAVPGFCAPLKAITAGGAPRPLDYGPLSRYLDAAGPEAAARVEAELKPGSSYVSLRATDVDEALRALESPHAVIRWHAASLLGDRSLGAKTGKRVLPALAERLGDPHPIVRRLAVLAIGRWKAAAQPHRASLERLREDPDELVRRIVEHELSRT